jgi:hypothetical protein
MSIEHHTYRIPFLRLFVAMLVTGQVAIWLVFGVILLADVVVFGVNVAVGGQLIGMVAASVLSSVLMAPAAVWMQFALPVRVSANHFACPNGFGKMVTVPWASIQEVRPFTIPGLPYLVVKTDRTRVKLWLPLFLRQLPELVEKVGQFAGHDHVLYRALWVRTEQRQ